MLSQFSAMCRIYHFFHRSHNWLQFIYLLEFEARMIYLRGKRKHICSPSLKHRRDNGTSRMRTWAAMRMRSFARLNHREMAFTDVPLGKSCFTH